MRGVTTTMSSTSSSHLHNVVAPRGRSRALAIQLPLGRNRVQREHRHLWVRGTRDEGHPTAQEVPEGNPGHKEYEGSAIPTPEEDKEVAHEAFMHAFEASRPESCRVKGLQEFASAIWARKNIPSQQYVDPLKHIFEVGLVMDCCMVLCRKVCWWTPQHSVIDTTCHLTPSIVYICRNLIQMAMGN